jgi:hypothetical protein
MEGRKRGFLAKAGEANPMIEKAIATAKIVVNVLLAKGVFIKSSSHSWSNHSSLCPLFADTSTSKGNHPIVE